MKVACVLITHLRIKAELMRYPELRGKPVIVTQSTGSKQVVLDRSPEARGVVAGMPLQESVSRCKAAVLLEDDERYYHSVFDGVLRHLEQRSPLVEEAEVGCSYVGLDGLEPMYGGEARLITSLLQVVPHHFNPRIGLASGKFPAYVAAVASRGGQAHRVPDDVAGFLKDLPIDLLPLSWENKTRLHRFGLHSLGELAILSVGSLQAQFGLEGTKAWKLANGIDHSPLIPYQREETITEYLTFLSPIITHQAVLTAVETLLSRAFARPEVRGRYVRTINIESEVLRHPPWTKRFALKEAVGSKERAFFALKSSLDTITLPGPLEDMKLSLFGFTGEAGMQAGLFSDIRKREQLRETMRQLEARFGCQPPIYQVREVEPWSIIPERRQALVPFAP